MADIQRGMLNASNAAEREAAAVDIQVPAPAALKHFVQQRFSLSAQAGQSPADATAASQTISTNVLPVPGFPCGWPWVNQSLQMSSLAVNFPMQGWPQYPAPCAARDMQQAWAATAATVGPMSAMLNAYAAASAYDAASNQVFPQQQQPQPMMPNNAAGFGTLAVVQQQPQKLAFPNSNATVAPIPASLFGESRVAASMIVHQSQPQQQDEQQDEQQVGVSEPAIALAKEQARHTHQQEQQHLPRATAVAAGADTEQLPSAALAMAHAAAAAAAGDRIEQPGPAVHVSRAGGSSSAAAVQHTWAGQHAPVSQYAVDTLLPLIRQRLQQQQQRQLAGNPVLKLAPQLAADGSFGSSPVLVPQPVVSLQPCCQTSQIQLPQLPQHLPCSRAKRTNDSSLGSCTKRSKIACGRPASHGAHQQEQHQAHASCCQAGAGNGGSSADTCWSCGDDSSSCSAQEIEHLAAASRRLRSRRKARNSQQLQQLTAVLFHGIQLHKQQSERVQRLAQEQSQEQLEQHLVGVQQCPVEAAAAADPRTVSKEQTPEVTLLQQQAAAVEVQQQRLNGVEASPAVSPADDSAQRYSKRSRCPKTSQQLQQYWSCLLSVQQDGESDGSCQHKQPQPNHAHALPQQPLQLSELQQLHQQWHTEGAHARQQRQQQGAEALLGQQPCNQQQQVQSHVQQLPWEVLLCDESQQDWDVDQLLLNEQQQQQQCVSMLMPSTQEHQQQESETSSLICQQQGDSSAELPQHVNLPLQELELGFEHPSKKRSALARKPQSAQRLQQVFSRLLSATVVPPPVSYAAVPTKKRSEVPRQPQTEEKLQQIWAALFPRRQQQRLQELVQWEQAAAEQQQQRKGLDKLQRWREQRQLQRQLLQQQQQAGGAPDAEQWQGASHHNQQPQSPHMLTTQQQQYQQQQRHQWQLRQRQRQYANREEYNLLPPSGHKPGRPSHTGNEMQIQTLSSAQQQECQQHGASEQLGVSMVLQARPELQHLQPTLAGSAQSYLQLPVAGMLAGQQQQHLGGLYSDLVLQQVQHQALELHDTCEQLQPAAQPAGAANPAEQGPLEGREQVQLPAQPAAEAAMCEQQHLQQRLQCLLHDQEQPQSATETAPDPGLNQQQEQQLPAGQQITVCEAALLERHMQQPEQHLRNSPAQQLQSQHDAGGRCQHGDVNYESSAAAGGLPQLPLIQLPVPPTASSAGEYQAPPISDQFRLGMAEQQHHDGSVTALIGPQLAAAGIEEASAKMTTCLAAAGKQSQQQGEEADGQAALNQKGVLLCAAAKCDLARPDDLQEHIQESSTAGGTSESAAAKPSGQQQQQLCEQDSAVVRHAQEQHGGQQELPLLAGDAEQSSIPSDASGAEEQLILQRRGQERLTVSEQPRGLLLEHQQQHKENLSCIVNEVAIVQLVQAAQANAQQQQLDCPANKAEQLQNEQPHSLADQPAQLQQLEPRVDDAAQQLLPCALPTDVSTLGNDHPEQAGLEQMCLQTLLQQPLRQEVLQHAGTGQPDDVQQPDMQQQDQQQQAPTGSDVGMQLDNQEGEQQQEQPLLHQEEQQQQAPSPASSLQDGQRLLQESVSQAQHLAAKVQQTAQHADKQQPQKFDEAVGTELHEVLLSPQRALQQKVKGVQNEQETRRQPNAKNADRGKQQHAQKPQQQQKVPAGQSKQQEEQSKQQEQQQETPCSNLPYIIHRTNGGRECWELSWCCMLKSGGRKFVYFGRYSSESEAVQARDLAALALFGSAVQTHQPASSYTDADIAATRRQLAEKPAALVTMQDRGFWPLKPSDKQQAKQKQRQSRATPAKGSRLATREQKQQGQQRSAAQTGKLSNQTAKRRRSFAEPQPQQELLLASASPPAKRTRLALSEQQQQQQPTAVKQRAASHGTAQQREKRHAFVHEQLAKAEPTMHSSKTASRKGQLQQQEQQYQPLNLKEGLSKHCIRLRFGRWEVRLQVKGKHVLIGTYSSEAEAVSGRDLGSLALFGDGGRTLRAAGNYKPADIEAMRQQLGANATALAVMKSNQLWHEPLLQLKEGQSMHGIRLQAGKWEVRLTGDGSFDLFSGVYTSEAAAVHARDTAVLALHGDGAKTLRPPGSYTAAAIESLRQQLAAQPTVRAVMQARGLLKDGEQPSKEPQLNQQQLQASRANQQQQQKTTAGCLQYISRQGVNSWVVRLPAEGKQVYVGSYTSTAEAVKARDLAVVAMLGDPSSSSPTFTKLADADIAAMRQQLAEKPRARRVMIANGLWPTAKHAEKHQQVEQSASGGAKQRQEEQGQLGRESSPVHGQDCQPVKQLRQHQHQSVLLQLQEGQSKHGIRLRSGKYEVRLQSYSNRKIVGTRPLFAAAYTTEAEAVQARDLAAIALHGDGAQTVQPAATYATADIAAMRQQLAAAPAAKAVMKAKRLLPEDTLHNAQPQAEVAPEQQRPATSVHAQQQQQQQTMKAVHGLVQQDAWDMLQQVPMQHAQQQEDATSLQQAGQAEGSAGPAAARGVHHCAATAAAEHSELTAAPSPAGRAADGAAGVVRDAAIGAISGPAAHASDNTAVSSPATEAVDSDQDALRIHTLLDGDMVVVASGNAAVPPSAAGEEPAVAAKPGAGAQQPQLPAVMEAATGVRLEQPAVAQAAGQSKLPAAQVVTEGAADGQQMLPAAVAASAASGWPACAELPAASHGRLSSMLAWLPAAPEATALVAAASAAHSLWPGAADAHGMQAAMQSFERSSAVPAVGPVPLAQPPVQGCMCWASEETAAAPAGWWVTDQSGMLFWWPAVDHTGTAYAAAEWPAWMPAADDTALYACSATAAEARVNTAGSALGPDSAAAPGADGGPKSNAAKLPDKHCKHCGRVEKVQWRKLDRGAPNAADNIICNRCFMWRRNHGELPNNDSMQLMWQPHKASMAAEHGGVHIVAGATASAAGYTEDASSSLQDVAKAVPAAGDAAQQMLADGQYHFRSRDKHKRQWRHWRQQGQEESDSDTEQQRGQFQRDRRQQRQRWRQQRSQQQQDEDGAAEEHWQGNRHVPDREEADTDVHYSHMQLPDKDAQPGDYKRLEEMECWSPKAYDRAAAAGAKLLGVPVVCPKPRRQHQRSASFSRSSSAGSLLMEAFSSEAALQAAAAAGARAPSGGNTAAMTDTSETDCTEHASQATAAATACVALGQTIGNTGLAVVAAASGEATSSAEATGTGTTGEAGADVVAADSSALSAAATMPEAPTAALQAVCRAFPRHCTVSGRQHNTQLAIAQPGEQQEQQIVLRRGVVRKGNKWEVAIRILRHELYIGTFYSDADAIQARDLAVLAILDDASQTLEPASSYTADDIATMKQQLAEKRTARAVMQAVAAYRQQQQLHLVPSSESGTLARPIAAVHMPTVTQQLQTAQASVGHKGKQAGLRNGESSLPAAASSAELGVLILAHEKGVPHAAAWEEWEAQHNGQVVVLVHMKADVQLCHEGSTDCSSDAVPGSNWIVSGRLLQCRVASKWGDVSLTEAIFASTAEMLQNCPRLQHIAVVSGQDVPAAAVQLPLPAGASMFGCFQFGREYDEAAREMATALLRAKMGMGAREAEAWGDALTFHHTWLILSRQLLLALLYKQDEILKVGAVLHERFMQPDAEVAADEFLLCTAAIRYGFVKQIERRSIAAFVRAESQRKRQQQVLQEQQEARRHQHHLRQQLSRKQQLQQQFVRNSSRRALQCHGARAASAAGRERRQDSAVAAARQHKHCSSPTCSRASCDGCSHGNSSPSLQHAACQFSAQAMQQRGQQLQPACKGTSLATGPDDGGNNHAARGATAAAHLPPRRPMPRSPAKAVVLTGSRHRVPSSRLLAARSSTAAGGGTSSMVTRAASMAGAGTVQLARPAAATEHAIGYGVLLDCCPTLALFHPTITRHPHIWRNFSELLLCDVNGADESTNNRLGLLQALGLAKPNGALFFRKVDVARAAAQEMLLRLLRLMWQDKPLPSSLAALAAMDART